MKPSHDDLRHLANNVRDCEGRTDAPLVCHRANAPPSSLRHLANDPPSLRIKLNHTILSTRIPSRC